MKLFVGAEHAFHSLRRKVYRSLNALPLFRKATLRRLSDDVLWITAKAGDHIITFSPREVIGKHIYQFGHFQRDLTNRVLQILSDENLLRGSVVLEVGSNIGTQSIYLMLSGHFENIVCIEPDERNVRLLRRNLFDNGLSRKATIFQCAAGSENGQVTFHIDDVNHGASGVAKKTTGSSRSTIVPLRRVDEIILEAGIHEQSIGFVWMDIEGAEPEALKSMEELTARRVPMLTEFSPQILGKEMTELFVAYLAARYERCVFFTDTTEQRMLVKDIPMHPGDVLLLG